MPRSAPRGLRPWLGGFAILLTLVGLFTMGPNLPKVQSAPPPETAPPPPSPTAGTRLCFLLGGQLGGVTRDAVTRDGVTGELDPLAGREEAVRILLTALLAGPTPAEAAQGISSAFPPEATLAGLEVRDETVTATLALPASFLADGFDAIDSDLMVQQVLCTLDGLGLYNYHLLALDPQAPGTARSISDFLPPVAPAPYESPLDDIAAPLQEDTISGQPPVYGQGQPQGALSGKTVYVSAGHGWYWTGTRWATQRGNTCDLVEDLSNAEIVDYYLLRYLWNAGAEIVTVRERDMNTAEVIVDNNDGPPGYTITGTWYTSLYTGYLNLPYSYTWAMTTETAIATWTPDIPQDGPYGVYVWYRPSPNRVTDALTASITPVA